MHDVNIPMDFNVTEYKKFIIWFYISDTTNL